MAVHGWNKDYLIVYLNSRVVHGEAALYASLQEGTFEELSPLPWPFTNTSPEAGRFNAAATSSAEEEIILIGVARLSFAALFA